MGVIIAFVYGYGGMFAAGNMTLANIYPITAGLGMIGYRNYDTAVHWNKEDRWGMDWKALIGCIILLKIAKNKLQYKIWDFIS